LVAYGATPPGGRRWVREARSRHYREG